MLMITYQREADKIKALQTVRRLATWMRLAGERNSWRSSSSTKKAGSKRKNVLSYSM